MKHRNWLTFECPPQMLKQIRVNAKKNNRSISGEVRTAVAQYLAEGK